MEAPISWRDRLKEELEETGKMLIDNAEAIANMGLLKDTIGIHVVIDIFPGEESVINVEYQLNPSKLSEKILN